ncbi:hypothetical protein JTB14_018444 [Gonioctena quinquepunctata]|nr:hypothetical protein JTB14_018444 [Gonioctena quinquepunctata]
MELKEKNWKYFKVLRTESSESNIAFGFTRSDTCSACDTHLAKIKGLEASMRSIEDKTPVKYKRMERERHPKTLETENKLHKSKAEVVQQRKRDAKKNSQQSISTEGIRLDYTGSRKTESIDFEFAMELDRKKKSVSFSVEEQLRLLDLINKGEKYNENKTTNKFTNDEKDKAWQRVTAAFNALALHRRNMDQLKSKYDNLKTKTRKVVAAQRTYIKGTGGGPPVTDKFDPVIENVLKIINIKTVVGF